MSARRMFSKILVANRGEIAGRIMRTAKRLGIATVAVYSDADRGALHVRMADEAVAIGPAPAGQSYLAIERIVEAARQTGADAVHPGYGFLSENPAFAEALEAAAIAFIGPPPAAIRAMGDKVAAKEIAKAAGVATVPGSDDVVETEAAARTIAAAIGYPVMIKAAAGGGGKGMRIACDEAELREGFAAAAREAGAAFADQRLFMEKFVRQPRHIEMQILADRHGNIVHLGERECSLQRRHQKIVEEAPSPFLDDATRAAMGEQAIALARAVGYFSAGTVEFIVDADRNFHFLEMNTRLQVEHPVTELVTGIDLVEEMIRISAGERLRFAQADVRLDGWAIEGRLYAEDPYRGFLPSSGRLTRYRPPQEGRRGDGAVIRNDTGVEEGGEISIHYDPMIAKLCAWGATRDAAITALAEALDDFEVEGIGHNLPFLSALMAHPRFHEGRLSTGFIAEEWPSGFAGVTPSDEDARRLAAVAACVHWRSVARDRRIAGGSGVPGRDWVVSFAGLAFAVTVETSEAGMRIGFKDGGFTVASDWLPGRRYAHFHVGEKRIGVKVERLASAWRLRWRGIDVSAHVRSPRVAELARLMKEKAPADVSRLLLCPMPGVVTAIHVGAGEAVEAGQALATVEAMKMENLLRAERRGTVKCVAVQPGASLAVNQLILEFE